MTTLFIEPSSPWEEGYVENFDGKLRDELLAREQFDTLQKASLHAMSIVKHSRKCSSISVSIRSARPSLVRSAIEVVAPDVVRVRR